MLCHTHLLFLFSASQGVSSRLWRLAFCCLTWFEMGSYAYAKVYEKSSEAMTKRETAWACLHVTWLISWCKIFESWCLIWPYQLISIDKNKSLIYYDLSSYIFWRLAWLGESSGQGMFRYMSAVCLPRSSCCSIYSSQLRQRYAGVTIRKSFYSSSVGSQASEDCSVSFVSSKYKGNFKLLTMATIVSLMGRQLRLGLAAKRRSMSLRLSLPAREKFSRISWNAKYFPFQVCLRALHMLFSKIVQYSARSARALSGAARN